MRFVNTTINYACTFEPDVEITFNLVVEIAHRIKEYGNPSVLNNYPIPGTCSFETPPVADLELMRKAELDYRKYQEERRQAEIKKEEERLERERERKQRERERQEREKARQREQEEWEQQMMHTREKYGW